MRPTQKQSDIPIRLSSAQLCLYLFSYPDGLLHFLRLASLPTRLIASLSSRGIMFLSRLLLVAFSVRFVLNTCRAGIGQTPSHSLLTSQRSVRQRCFALQVFRLPYRQFATKQTSLSYAEVQS